MIIVNNADKLQQRLIHVITSLEHIKTCIKNEDYRVAYGIADKQIVTLKELFEQNFAFTLESEE